MQKTGRHPRSSYRMIQKAVFHRKPNRNLSAEDIKTLTTSDQLPISGNWTQRFVDLQFALLNKERLTQDPETRNALPEIKAMMAAG